MTWFAWAMLIYGSACAAIAVHYCFKCRRLAADCVRRLSQAEDKSLSAYYDGWRACEAHAAICPDQSTDE